jgi:hypothetical protein
VRPKPAHLDKGSFTFGLIANRSPPAPPTVRRTDTIRQEKVPGHCKSSWTGRHKRIGVISFSHTLQHMTTCSRRAQPVLSPGMCSSPGALYFLPQLHERSPQNGRSCYFRHGGPTSHTSAGFEATKREPASALKKSRSRVGRMSSPVCPFCSETWILPVHRSPSTRDPATVSR